jgi:type IV pilus assembly protein PilA
MDRIRNDRAFTLIELLTVVAIIGVVAAIAIPQFALYRQKTFDAAAITDLRNAAGAEEYNYATNEIYISCASASICEANLPGYSHSRGVNLAMTSGTGSFTGTASHTSGTRTFTYNSQAGGLQ